MATHHLTLVVHCVDFPGRDFGDYRAIRVGLQRGKTVVDAVPGDVEEATFTADITVHTGEDPFPDFGGPYVHGARGDRFVYLVWTTDDAPQTPFRRAKLPLRELTTADVVGERLVAQVSLTDLKREPISGTIPPRALTWRR